MALYNSPDLFQVYYNAGENTPFDGGDFCAFVNRPDKKEDWEREVNQHAGF